MKLLFKETFRVIKGNLSSSFFIIMINGIATLFLLIVLFFALNFSTIKSRIQSKFEAKVFFSTKVNNSNLSEFRKVIAKSGIIEKEKFISSEEARKIFHFRFKKIGKDIINQVELPASFTLRFKDETDYSRISKFLKDVEKLNYVEAVVFPHKVVFSFAKYFSIISFTLMLILLLLSIGIFIIVKHLLSRFVSNDFDKLNIKYLIGAKKSTIILPYYFASILLCFVSTLLTLFFLDLLLYEIIKVFTINMLENKILFSNIIILFLSLYAGYVVAPKNLHF